VEKKITIDFGGSNKNNNNTKPIEKTVEKSVEKKVVIDFGGGSTNGNKTQPPTKQLEQLDLNDKPVPTSGKAKGPPPPLKNNFLTVEKETKETKSPIKSPLKEKKRK